MQNKVSLFLGLVLSGVILTMLTWGFYGDGLQSWTAVVENNYQNPGERSKIAGTDYGASGHEIEASVEECPKGKTFVPEKYFEYGTKYKLLPGDTHREAGRNQFPEKVLAKLPPVEDVKEGGYYKPPPCQGRVVEKRLAILIPFRNRLKPAQAVTAYLHHFLQAQGNVEYKIYFITQSFDDHLVFNKGSMFNFGFKYAMKDNPNWNCLILHDGDMMPMNMSAAYECREKPFSISRSLSRYNFKEIYASNFGGVVSLTPEQFTKVNGFSTLFWGWGGEDDNFYHRVVHAYGNITANDFQNGRFMELHHEQAPFGEHRMQMSSVANFIGLTREGLNTTQVTFVSKVEARLFTNITVLASKAMYDKAIHFLNQFKETTRRRSRKTKRN